MTLYSGGPFLVDSFMADEDTIPPPTPVPVPPPTHSSYDDEDVELMLIGTIGSKSVAAGAETKTVTVPRTTDASNNNAARRRFGVCQIDVTLDAAGVVEAYWNDNTAQKVYILTGRRQLMIVPADASTLNLIFPGAGTATTTFGITD